MNLFNIENWGRESGDGIEDSFGGTILVFGAVSDDSSWIGTLE